MEKENEIKLESQDTIIDTPENGFNEDNIFSLKEKDLDQIVYNISMYTSKVDFKVLNSIEATITKFAEIEKSVMNYLRDKKDLKLNQKKLLNMLTLEMMEQKFSEKENSFYSKINKINEDIYFKISEEITEDDYKHFFEFLNTKANKNNLNSEEEFGIPSFEEIDNLKIENTFKEIYSIIYSLYISDLSKILKCSEIPYFLLKKNKNKIRQKVKYIFNPYIKEFYYLLMENKAEVVVLKNFFHSFTLGIIDIFDFNFLKHKLLYILLKILVLSNVDYLQRDDLAYSLFCRNFEKYCKLMHIAKVLKIDDQNYSYLSNKLLEKIMIEIFGLPKKEREEMMIVSLEILRDFIKDNNQKYFFIIFSFSFMLNGIISSKKGKQEMSSNISCNSRERQLLQNFLKVINNFLNFPVDAFEINSFSQSLVINNILKASSPEIFDSHLQVKKNFTIDIIQDTIKGNCNNKKILEEFELLTNSYHIRSETGIKKYFKDILNSTLSYYNKEKVIYDLSTVMLKSFDQFVLSTNVCLCVSGFTSDGIDQQRAWENLSLDMNKYNDLYYFNWPSETIYSFLRDVMTFLGNSILNYLKEDYIKLITDAHAYATSLNLFHKAKDTAKICGKILAHLIASRAIFKFQTINLVGFSLGSHLIKHCLKELDKLAEHNSELKHVIQNVVLVAGATHFKNQDKWVERFKSLVAGRIINCHGKNDHILKFLYKISIMSDAIGFKPCDFQNEIFENWDFTHLNIGHMDYRKHMDLILKTIKLY